MPRIRLTLAYTGTHYHGWQLQAHGPTIQGTVEAALERLVGVPTRVHGAGRTDAGVHAVGQVAHFDVAHEKRHIPWQRALNAVLPGDICVREAGEVDADFHARFSATAKEYSYTLWTEPAFVLPQRRPFTWATGPLDLAAMDAAARHLVGTHDFASFQNAGTPVQDTCRTLTTITRSPGPTPWEWTLRFEANGFLKQMVRNIVGLLVAVGRGRITEAAVPGILAARDRKAAPSTAPAQGLCLEWVRYDHG